VPAIREKSLRLTRRLMEAATARGWRLNTPSDDRERGASVVIDVPDGARVTQELIARGVIVDFRPGAGIRLAPHFYNTESEIDHAVQTMEDITVTT
jgi:kynureninase